LYAVQPSGAHRCGDARARGGGVEAVIYGRGEDLEYHVATVEA
jgi:hypothetical protein